MAAEHFLYSDNVAHVDQMVTSVRQLAASERTRPDLVTWLAEKLMISFAPTEHVGPEKAREVFALMLAEALLRLAGNDQ